MKNLFANKRNRVKVTKFSGFKNEQLCNLQRIRGGENAPTEDEFENDLSVGSSNNSSEEVEYNFNQS